MVQDYFCAALRRQLVWLASEAVLLAEAMPASNFDFVPAAGTRTFGEQARHLATVVYLTAALVRGERSPFEPGQNDNGPAAVRSKQETLAYLHGAFAYAGQTLEQLSDATAGERVPTYFGPQARGEVASGIIYHSYNHYGQMVVYARLCGVVPPGGS